jgi:hypothetical protein
LLCCVVFVAGRWVQHSSSFKVGPIFVLTSPSSYRYCRRVRNRSVGTYGRSWQNSRANESAFFGFHRIGRPSSNLIYFIHPIYTYHTYTNTSIYHNTCVVRTHSAPPRPAPTHVMSFATGREGLINSNRTYQY